MTIAWMDADWPAPPNVHAGTTLRQNGVSAGAYSSLNLAAHVADDAAAVAENRRRFVVDCGLPSEPVWLRQTHSVNVSLEAPPDPDTGTDCDDFFINPVALQRIHGASLHLPGRDSTIGIGDIDRKPYVWIFPKDRSDLPFQLDNLTYIVECGERVMGVRRD